MINGLISVLLIHHISCLRVVAVLHLYRVQHVSDTIFASMGKGFNNSECNPRKLGTPQVLAGLMGKWLWYKRKQGKN